MPPTLLNRIRPNGPRRATPLMGIGRASQGWTTQLEFTSGQTPNVHLPALEFSPTKNADPLVIERIPAPEGIAYAQNREPIIEINMSDHMQGAVCLLHQGTQSERGLIV
jgi:hypothetical protein